VGTAADGGFQGIDPAELQQLMKSMTSGVSGAQPVAGSYVGQFNRLGLGTSAITKLLADYSWASGQQPMLQRRYSLASHQPSGDFTDGWTTAGAGTLLFTTTGAAKAAGTADAKNMQAALDARNWKAIQAQLAAMSANGGDADYMAAFFTQLGPSGLYGLSLYAQGGPSSDKANEQLVKNIVGSGLATASFEMPLSMKYLQGIEPKEPPIGYVSAEQPGGWDTGALAPFLTEGQFSDQWLKTMSPAVLYQAGSIESPGSSGPPAGYDAIFTAISSSPDFAATFYQQNAKQLNDYMTNPELYHYLANGEGFGSFLKAATIPPAGETSTSPFTANATAFVKLFGDSKSPIETSDAVRQVMAADVMNYFSDVTGTVTAAAPGAGSTMGLTQQQWGMFMQDSMKDKTSAAALLTFYASWSNQQIPDNLPTVNGVPMKGDKSLTPLQAGYWNDFSTGLLNYFFASNYQAAGKPAGDDGNAMLDLLKDAAAAGTATLVTSALFGPEAGAVELLGEAGKDAFSTTVEGSISTLTAKIGDGGEAPAEALDSGLVDIQQRWATNVMKDFTDGGGKPGAPGVPPVYWEGTQYTGDPKGYQTQPGSQFMDNDGRLLYGSPEDWAKHPQALAAYNAWLRDPAISSMTGPIFGTQTSGSTAGLYQQLMSGN
jgi:hypothetical protein